MVDKFNRILNQIIEEKGNITIFALLKMDEFVDKWTIVFSAPWSTASTTSADFDYIRALVLQELNEEERATIARIGIFQANEQLIQLLLQLKTGTVISEDTKLNGNVLHEGYILASNS